MQHTFILSYILEIVFYISANLLIVNETQSDFYALG